MMSAEDRRASQLLSIDVVRTAPDVLLALAGELDVSTVDDLSEVVREEAAYECGQIVLDLGGLRFLDATGMRAILELGDALGPRLALRKGPPVVQRVFELTGAGRTLVWSPYGSLTSPAAARNVLYVRELWEAFEDGGVESFLDMVPDGVRWLPRGTDAEVLRGSRALRLFWRRVGVETVAMPTAFSAIGDDVLVESELPLHGSEMKSLWSLYKFRGRTLTTATSFELEADARAAAL